MSGVASSNQILNIEKCKIISHMNTILRFVGINRTFAIKKKS